MGGEEWLLWVHVLAAILWVGGAGVITVLNQRAVSDGAAAVLLGRARDNKLIGPFFGISSLVVLGTGVWLVFAEDEWAFDQGWILVSLLLTAALVVIGFGFHAPHQIKLVPFAEQRGGDDPHVVAEIARWVKFSVIEIAGFVFVVWLMVVRPWV